MHRKVLQDVAPFDIRGNVPWYHPNTKKPLFEPHAENVREHTAVLEECGESILDNGVVQDCRGRLFVCLSLGSAEPGVDLVDGGLHLRLLTWGTLGRVFYAIDALHPTHMNVMVSSPT